MKKNILSLSFIVLFTFTLNSEENLHENGQNRNLQYQSLSFNALKYRCIGPSRGGRVTTVTGIPDQPSTFYMGATGGGVWKTTDYGANWINISDKYFKTASIGAVRVAPTDPDVVYVGTGSDGLRSNVITGRGVYRSVDAGKTWEFIGLSDTGQIGAVEIHPQDPNTVVVAAIGQAFSPNPARGIFRTKDGGQNWEKVLFISENTGAVDVEFAPGNPDIIYACLWQAERKPWTIISGGEEGGLYKSTDGGDTWKQIINGLPSGLRGKSDLAVSPANPKRVYILMEAPKGQGGLYRSDDWGESFQLISTYARLLARPFYYCNIDTDPVNADIVYSSAESFNRSVDGGKTWKRLSTPHGDNHDLWINPNDPDMFIQSNDGGANITMDGGKTWSTQHNQPTAELYQVAVDDQFPYWVYAGQQDSSTIMVPSLPPYSPASGPTGFWQAVGGCETGPAVPKPGNHNIVYANCKGRFGRYNKLTGQEKQYYVGAANIYGHNPKDLKFRFQRVSPIHVSPHDPDVVYHASQYLHKTTDEGVTWEIISPDLTANEPDKQVISGNPITRDITGEEFYSTIYAVQESPLEKGLIWVGANDGPVHVTRDGGKSWTNVTPRDIPRGGRVQTIEPSPHRPNKAYFAVYRYLLGDWEPYIYKTEDYGASWERISSGYNGIPLDTPARVIREDPDREGLLYAGTEFGAFISFDDGKSWQPFQLNLPVTPVTDIKIYQKDLVLSTMGRSIWILDNITPLHQINKKIADKDYFLFKPRKAYRMRYRSYRRSPADPEYPPPGVMIDYYFSQKQEEEIFLEISDTFGRIIKTFSSESGSPRVAKSAGMHRFIWDMRHERPGEQSPDESSDSRSFSHRNGPLVVPATYQAIIRAGNWSENVDFEIVMDPRVAADGLTISDLRAQEQLSLEILALLNKAQNAVDRIDEFKKQLDEDIKAGGRKAHQAKQIDQKLAEIRMGLETAEGPYPEPKLIDQINYLYNMLDRADQRPGRDAYQRFEELTAAVNLCIDEINSIF
ncbi:MAG: hypothetical protein JW755_06190 [Candidatus Aminicenantes bacterium]|nr:hypothetical protein [Candidatus Aminicenantes bacterium]